MKYTIGDKIFLGDKKCMVFATREIPYKPEIDYLNRKEIYPDSGYDYLLYFLDERKQEEYYSGPISVTESQIEDIRW